MNTYGICSVNYFSFQLSSGCSDLNVSYDYPRKSRNILVTLLKLHNLILNTLGYCSKLSPKIPFVSGFVRVLSGVGLCVGTLTFGDRHASQGILIRHRYDEALLTGMAQIVRGILTTALATNSYGWVVNASLDGLGTFYYFGKYIVASVEGGYGGGHPDPSYPFPLGILNLA